jgi:AbrB family looped-hinge helix DNA binding protein
MAKDLFTNVSSERKRGSPTRDSETGRVYPSRNQTYKALASQLGLDPEDQYGWNALCRKFPGRFVDVHTNQPIGARGEIISKSGIFQHREVEVQIGPQGRLVVPAIIREALKLQPGDKLIARVEESRLVLEKREHVLARLKARFRNVPKSISLADELINERRAEAHQEQSA